jgi:hypothetical protein
MRINEPGLYHYLFNENGFIVRDFGKRCMKPALPKVPKQYEKEIFSNFLCYTAFAIYLVPCGENAPIQHMNS